MAWYQNGTVGVTNGSPTVVGTTTQWVANVNIGNGFYGPDFREYEITGVTDDTHITISPAYQGTTVASGATYKIVPVQGYLRTTAAALALLVTAAGAFLNLTPADKDIIQYNSGAWTTRTPAQYLLDGSNAYVEASIASAATTNIGTATTPKVQITGTNTITSFGSTANCLRFVRFGGALILTHNATSLILPRGVNITTVAGDTAIFMSDASGNWRCMAYSGQLLSTFLEVVQPNKNLSDGLNGDAQVHIAAMTSDTATIDMGGAIGMGGFYNTTTTRQLFGAIAGRKTNATAGNASGYLAFFTNNNTSLTETMRLTDTGRLGIGVIPAMQLDIGKTQNSSTLARISNASTGNAGYAGFRCDNNSEASYFYNTSTGYTAAGLDAPSRTIIQASGANGLAFHSTLVSTGIFFGINSIEVCRVTGSGLQIGITSRNEALAVVGQSSFNTFMVFNSSAVMMMASGLASYVASTGWNGANTMLYLAKDGTSARSINAAGTINPTGSDYAEYETKALDCGTVAKGQVVGFDVNGRITDKWANVASRFCVKTTDPGVCGGDVWGSDEVLGMVRPEAPPRHIKNTANYDTAIAVWSAKLEKARQTVDRIAYAGKCPCNVLSAAIGDYIIPQQDGIGIKGVPVTSPTFDEYRTAVGRVVSLLPDGRCTIALITH